jgi:hypothetical protein
MYSKDRIVSTEIVMIYENIFDSLETGLPLTRKAKKTEQINIRFTEKAVQDLDRIAAAESRDRSELARFFVEWASAQYDSVGSLRTLLRSPALPRNGPRLSRDAGTAFHRPPHHLGTCSFCRHRGCDPQNFPLCRRIRRKVNLPPPSLGYPPLN